MDKTKSAKPYRINGQIGCRLNRNFQIKICLILILTVFGAVMVPAQSVPSALVTPLPPSTPRQTPRQTPRALGQKYIEEVWHELETANFATPTFEELGTLHEGYSLEELWEIAQTSHPSLRQKANLITAATGKRLQAGLYPNPILTYSGDNLGVHGKIGKHGLSVTQEIVTAKKKKLNRAITSYDVEAARKIYAMECARLQNDLRIAHCEMLHAILIQKVDEFAQDLSRDLLHVALTLQEQGKSRSIDVLQFRTMLNTADLIFKQTNNNRFAVWQRLVSIMGTPDLPYQPVRGSLIDHSLPRDWQSTWAQFQQTSPQLVLARLKTAQARMYLAREEAEQTSNVFATFSLARDIPAETTVPFVGISVPLKIYDKNQGNILKARSEVAATQREVERITLALHKHLSTIFYDHNNACELIRVYETNIIPDSFEALRQIGESYYKNEMTYLELYAQRQAVVNILIRYIDALKTKAVTTILIDGMLLEGTLN
ncbi:MAG: TolC family protein [Planctomycetaceae bacterium]|jgi:cobalt-zinc-cadmium efflux system outer membrane protein|nr:TolC family protein [Planctomycetaceae bacterium]